MYERKRCIFEHYEKECTSKKKKKKEGNIELKVSGQSQFQVIRKIRKIDEALK